MVVTPQDILQKSKDLSPFDPAWKTEENRVHGCQSLMYLHAELKEGKLYFFAHSDALISAGLAAMLIEEMNGKDPETLLKATPELLENVAGALSPGRSNGIAHLWLKMKQKALAFLLKSA